MPLKAAREERDGLRAQVARGVDPRIHRLQSKVATLTAPTQTFAAVFQVWRDFKALSLKPGRQSTLSQMDRIFAKDVLPWLGHFDIFEVENTHLLEVLRRIERRKAFSMAEKVRTWLNQMFRYAMVERGLRHYNGQETTKLGLCLLLLTGVRTGELRLAVPEQFDLERGLWVIPPQAVKQLQVKLRREGHTVAPYVVPLSRQAVAIFRHLLQQQTRRPAQRYLLPQSSDIKKRISENTLNGALHRMGYANRLTGHGIRATISTALNELGYRKEWIEVQLSHVDPNQVRAAYNHAAYVEQRRRMMQDWADFLGAWERGEPVKIAALSSAASGLYLDIPSSGQGDE